MEAYDRALSLLKGGIHTESLSLLVAKMWKSTPTEWLKAPMGRPIKKVPSYWYAIGTMHQRVFKKVARHGSP